MSGNDIEYSPLELMLQWNALGLAGEAGEVVDLIKKQVCHKHGIDRDAIAKELGDVLWYVAAICTKLDLNLQHVAQQNISKLQERYPKGYSSEASKNR